MMFFFHSNWLTSGKINQVSNQEILLHLWQKGIEQRFINIIIYVNYVTT